MNTNPLTAPAIEQRSFNGTIAVRADAGQRRIVGYAAKFGKLSRNLGGFVEMVGPTAFNEWRGLGWPDVAARYNHESNFLLGTSHTEGRDVATLRLSIDSVGLLYEIDPPRTRADVVELIDRGDVRHSSFAFRTIADAWGVTPEGYPLRTLVSVELLDVAPVGQSPAYPDTTSALRSLALAADRDMGEVTRLAGEDNLHVLWGHAPRPQPTPHAPARLLGAAARGRLLEFDAARGVG